jgi:hypothetical protein
MPSASAWVDIIRAVQSPLGLAALMVLVVGAVAVAFFAKGPFAGQLVAFLTLAAGFGFFIWVVLTLPPAWLASGATPAGSATATPPAVSPTDASDFRAALPPNTPETDPCEMATSEVEANTRAAGEALETLRRVHERAYEGAALDASFCDALAQALSDYQRARLTLGVDLKTIHATCSLDPVRSRLLQMVEPANGFEFIAGGASTTLASCPKVPATDRECLYLKGLKSQLTDQVTAHRQLGSLPADMPLSGEDLGKVRSAALLFRDIHERAKEMDVPTSLRPAHKAWLRQVALDAEASARMVGGLATGDVKQWRAGWNLYRTVDQDVHGALMKIFHQVRSLACEGTS